jgi:hypothetical protein
MTLFFLPVVWPFKVNPLSADPAAVKTSRRVMFLHRTAANLLSLPAVRDLHAR